ncbi:DUF6898 family protein [Indioceanicola profundi]|uniref:DUF6898 family protein n=1 Tax=Indioceanicola profundi TaxID=2220096 RepID=UPI000E6AD1E8|nr:hypothetical protein [Indioceanicola profundi]
MAQVRDGSALLEFRTVGTITRVSAIDPATNTEVVIQGPSSAGRATLTRTAIAKLNYVLGKRAG